MKRLSIITINRNNRSGLAETLRSTLEFQRHFDDFEQIVVDGASTDGSLDVIRRCESRLSWWCSEPDHGIYNAMNKGAAHATGEYLLFLNSGDTLKEDSLEKVFAEGFSEALVYADIDTKRDGKLIRRRAVSSDELTPGWFLFDSLPHQATLIRRELHEKYGGYDESMRISAAPKFIFDAFVRDRCSIRKLDLVFSEFDGTGISSSPKHLAAKLKEWEYFLKPYFGARVVANAMHWLQARPILDPTVFRLLEKQPDMAPRLREMIAVSLRMGQSKFGRSLFRFASVLLLALAFPYRERKK